MRYSQVSWAICLLKFLVPGFRSIGSFCPMVFLRIIYPNGLLSYNYRILDIITSTLKNQSSCWLGGWVRFPNLDASSLLGNGSSPSQAGATQQHFSPWLPLPAPYFEVSSPAEERTRLPVNPYQNHGSLQPSVNQPWLQFTFLHQPKMVPVLMQVRALSRLLINS